MLTNEDLQKLSLHELSKELDEVESHLMKLGLELQARSSKSTSKLNDLRKQRARIKTFRRILQLETKERLPDGNK